MSNVKPTVSKTATVTAASTEAKPATTATPAISTAEAARQKRMEAMKVSNSNPAPTGDGEEAKAAKPKKDKAPAFVVDVALQTELRALTGPQLIERAKDQLRAVDAADTTLLALGVAVDATNGQPVTKSSIRSAIYDFVESRPEKRATVAEICAYMTLGTGRIYKGSFNAGYIRTARGEDTRRGMVARRQLTIISRAPKPEAAKA